MSAKSLTLYPNPKINLGLFITGKRDDGYHLLETIYYPIDLIQDEMSIIESNHSDCQLTMEGIAIDGNVEENLCVKAYRILQKEIPGLPGVNIHLHKRIPAGSGLGGGSSNAAHTLKGLNELFDLGYNLEQLATFGETLGADVPFFLYNRPLLASGIGTVFENIELDLPFRIELVIPEIHSSTVAAYKALDYTRCWHDKQLRTVVAQPVETWKDELVNDLEIPVFGMHPEIADIKYEMYESGAIYAAMSGSGSAVFGLFEGILDTTQTSRD